MLNRTIRSSKSLKSKSKYPKLLIKSQLRPVTTIHSNKIIPQKSFQQHRTLISTTNSKMGAKVSKSQIQHPTKSQFRLFSTGTTPDHHVPTIHQLIPQMVSQTQPKTFGPAEKPRIVHESRLITPYDPKLHFDQYDTFIFDFNGVLGSGYLFPFSSPTLSALHKAGKKIIVASNNSSATRTLFYDIFHETGFNHLTIDHFVNATGAATLYAASQGYKKVITVGGPSLDVECERQNINTISFLKHFQDCFNPDFIKKEQIDAIIYSGARIWSHDNSQNPLVELVKRTQLPIIIAESIPHDVHFPNATYTMKPHNGVFNEIQRLHPTIDLKRTLMIGDQLKTDVHFANNVGIDSLIVLTGAIQPDHLVNYALKGHETLSLTTEPHNIDFAQPLDKKLIHSKPTYIAATVAELPIQSWLDFVPRVDGHTTVNKNKKDDLEEHVLQ